LKEFTIAEIQKHEQKKRD